MEDAAFELEYLEPALKKPLQIAAFLSVIGILLPMRLDAGGPLWWWHLRADPGSMAVLVSQIVAASAFWMLSANRSLDKLTKAIIAGALLLVAGALTLNNPDTRAGLMPFVPDSLTKSGPFIVAALGLAGAAVRFRHGPRDDELAGLTGRLLLGAAGLFTLLAYAWPHGTGTLATSVVRTLIVAFDAPFLLSLGLILLAGISLLPLGLVVYATKRVFAPKDPALSGIAWIIGIFPAMLLAIGLKAAASFGADVIALIAMRSSAFLVVGVTVVGYGVVAALSQLLDPRIEAGPHTQRLLRDELAYEALSTSVDKATDGYRARIVEFVQLRLTYVRDRLRDLRPDVTEDELTHIVRLHLGGVSEDAIQVGQWEETPVPPRAPFWVRWLARGRRLEGTAALCVVIVLSGSLTAAYLFAPRAPAWTMQPPPNWATKLYREHLPAIAINAQYADSNPKAFQRTVRNAIEAAKSEPKLAAAVAELASVVTDPGANRRAIRRAGDGLNDAARKANLPLYLDVNVRGFYESRWDINWVFYVKTYRIVRTRKASADDASYAALWVERLDLTNVRESNLGWRKHGQRYGMVIMDRLREHWHDDLWPALIGEGGDSGFEYWAEALIDELSEGDNDGVINEAIRCHREEDISIGCHQARVQADARALERLAQKVEVHELQHVIDDGDAEIPDELRNRMYGYTEESQQSAASELSAYLAEIAGSPQPRLSALHLASVARRRNSSESHAAAIAFDAMGVEDADGAVSLEPSELQARAKAAHEELFGGVLAQLTITDVD